MSRMMCVATPKVKPTRTSPRPSTRFGAGILRYVPTSAPTPFTTDDIAWLNQNPVTDEDRHFDAMAFDALATDRLCNGHCF
jgi:hypothetical protein